MKRNNQTKRSAFFILILLTLVTVIFSCSKSNEIDALYGYNIETSIELSILNSQNEDLLNSENPNHLDVKKIKLFNVINGKKQEVYDPDMDSPRNFFIFKHENEYRIRLFLNHTETSEKPITYIEWNDSDTDTIEVTYNRTKTSLLQNKIWLNGIQIWESGDNTIVPYFVLRK